MSIEGKMYLLDNALSMDLANMEYVLKEVWSPVSECNLLQKNLNEGMPIKYYSIRWISLSYHLSRD